MKSKKPSVYKYKDFIAFLKETLAFYQKKDNLSLRDICKKLNIQVSLLSMVLNKKRIPSDVVVKKIYRYLELSDVEIKSANQLKIIYKSKEIEIQKASLEGLLKNKKFQKENRDEYEFSQYLSKWYYVAIREMTALADFRDDADWIQNKLAFSVTKTEIRKALSFLKKTGIVVFENGKLTASQKQMNCEDGIFRISLSGFHKQILSLISKSIDVTPRDQRLILGYTLPLRDEHKVQAHQILTEAFDKIKQLDRQLSGEKKSENFSSLEAAKVYHVELALVPLSKTGDENGD